MHLVSTKIVIFIELQKKYLVKAMLLSCHRHDTARKEQQGPPYFVHTMFHQLVDFSHGYCFASIFPHICCFDKAFVPFWRLLGLMQALVKNVKTWQYRF